MNCPRVSTLHTIQHISSSGDKLPYYPHLCIRQKGSSHIVKIYNTTPDGTQNAKTQCRCHLSRMYHRISLFIWYIVTVLSAADLVSRPDLGTVAPCVLHRIDIGIYRNSLSAECRYSIRDVVRQQYIWEAGAYTLCEGKGYPIVWRVYMLINAIHKAIPKQFSLFSRGPSPMLMGCNAWYWCCVVSSGCRRQLSDI